MRLSQGNSRTCHYTLFQIRRDKTSAGGFLNWPIKLASLDRHACGSSAASTLIYEATDSITVSTSRAVIIQGRRRDGGVTARQRGLVSCQSREIGTDGVDLIL